MFVIRDIDIPPESQEPAQLAAVAHVAAPLVGAIILVFGALESVMRRMIVGVRMQKASRGNAWPPNTKLSHKARERLNEWIKEVLPASGKEADGDRFRERFLTVKHVRDNLAHNIEAMWIDRSNNLRVLTLWDSKNFDKDFQKWLSKVEANKSAPPPMPYEYAVYSADGLAVHYDEIRALLQFVNEVHQSPELPQPLSSQTSGSTRVRRTPGDPPANPTEPAQ